METKEILAELVTSAQKGKAAVLSGFFKTGKGSYGEGDRFLGVTVPLQRRIACRHLQAGHGVLGELLSSPWHEARLTALLILTEQFGRSRDPAFREACASFYLSHTDRINSWDLVDLSCYKILGAWLADRERDVLYRLAVSGSLWERRIAIVSCMHFVRRGDFKDCLAIADLLLQDPEDLIRKAVGWLLREVGKRDRDSLVSFLAPRYRKMPRTMLRYAIERFPEGERKSYLKTGIPSDKFNTFADKTEKNI